MQDFDFTQRLKNKLPAIASALVILFILVGLDQWTKWAIVKSIPLGESFEVVPGFFELTYVRNSGAAFSSLDGIGMWFFIIITFIALGVMIYYFFKSDNSKIDLALALLMAGAIGNLIDRIKFGYVRDFFLFYIFGSPFAVFNVADVCITLGFIVLMFALLIPEKNTTSAPDIPELFDEPKKEEKDNSFKDKEIKENFTQDTIKLEGIEIIPKFSAQKELEEEQKNEEKQEKE